MFVFLLGKSKPDFISVECRLLFFLEVLLVSISVFISVQFKNDECVAAGI